MISRKTLSFVLKSHDCLLDQFGMYKHGNSGKYTVPIRGSFPHGQFAAIARVSKLVRALVPANQETQEHQDNISARTRTLPKNTTPACKRRTYEHFATWCSCCIVMMGQDSVRRSFASIFKAWRLVVSWSTAHADCQNCHSHFNGETVC